MISVFLLNSREVCNGVACSLPKLESLEKTVKASLFHSGLHSGTIFLWKKTILYVILRNDKLCRFLTKTFYDAKLIFWSSATFCVLTIFWSGAAEQRICFRESISVLDQNGRIQALEFLARWRLTSHALYYKIPYWIQYCSTTIMANKTKKSQRYCPRKFPQCCFFFTTDNLDENRVRSCNRSTFIRCTTILIGYFSKESKIWSILIRE